MGMSQSWQYSKDISQQQRFVVAMPARHRELYLNIHKGNYNTLIIP